MQRNNASGLQKCRNIENNEKCLWFQVLCIDIFLGIFQWLEWARFEFDATKPTTQNIFTSVHYMNTFILRHTGVRFVVELQPLVLPKKAIGNFMKHLFAYLQ